MISGHTNLISDPPLLDRKVLVMSKLWIPLCTALVFSSSCSNGPSSSPDAPEPTVESTQPDHPASTSAPVTPEAPEAAATIAAPQDANHQPMATGEFLGPVLETMNAGGYTYVLLQTTRGEIWAAGPTTSVEVGHVVELSDAFPMEQFESPALDRTFEKIYFCGSIGKPVQTDVGAVDHMESAPVKTAGGAIALAENGQRVGDVIAKSADFVGKPVTIRARVVKFSANIMQKNWIHIQDGSGEEGGNDLTITTSATVAVGDIVMVKGTLIADKDFGYGYKYDLIIEDAEVTVE